MPITATVNQSYREAPLAYHELDRFSFIEMLSQSTKHAWDGINVWSYNLQPITDFNYVVTEQPVLILRLSSKDIIHWDFEGQRRHETTDFGSLFLLPQGATVGWRWLAPSRIMHIAISPTLVLPIADELYRGDPSRLVIRDKFNFSDPLMRQIGLALWNEAKSDGLFGRIYAESLGQTLALHTVRRYSNLTAVQRQFGRGLTHRQLQQLNDYIQDRIDRNISLAELADSLGLDLYPFIRQFKYSTGQPPYQYVLDARLDRARELLLEGKQTIAAIAQQTGFADQSHLTRLFKRRWGITPSTILKHNLS